MPDPRADSKKPERIMVLGIGNPLVKDEGVGIRVIETLMSSYAFDDNVTLVDAGTMGMSILNLFRECDYMLVVDAMDGTDEPAGTVVRLSPEEIAPNQVKHSLHDIRFIDVLQAAELIGHRPEAECVGVQVAEMVSMQIGLTPAVEAAVPDAVRAVLDVLAERGVTATPIETDSEQAAVLQQIREWERPEG